ncbi:E2 protein isoform 5 [Zea mays]|uniref:E2 protein isoform 5 n=1 Tax=Zea mays TaxID=4577 RepID=K7V9Y9_MAIZE|nr:E2 protein isoform 5 [Zea mays]AQK98612.1 E2 protein isoform 5 [Zea mays]
MLIILFRRVSVLSFCVLCRAYARKKGRNNVTVDDLIHVITPKGRASVPDSVKAELLQRIRSFLMSTTLR